MKHLLQLNHISLLGILFLFLLILNFNYSALAIETSNFNTVTHRVGHLQKESLTKLHQQKIGIIVPQKSTKMYYFDCTQNVINQVKEILTARPNGSEIFFHTHNSIINDITICHKHDGVIIECGEELFFFH